MSLPPIRPKNLSSPFIHLRLKQITGSLTGMTSLSNPIISSNAELTQAATLIWKFFSRPLISFIGTKTPSSPKSRGVAPNSRNVDSRSAGKFPRKMPYFHWQFTM